ncbi:hypothetical protein Bca4012_082371 [Brassica carinata]
MKVESLGFMLEFFFLFFGLHASSSLRSICLKELVNGQVFESLVASRTLKKLRIIRCLGNWDKVLQVNGDGDSSLTEIHLERLQVSDFGLSAISKCRKLETLHIVKTPECSNSGLVCVVERCRLLRKLHIDGWRTKRIGDEGLMALAKHCLLLQELVLIGVDATHASLSAIASNCKKLERWLCERRRTLVVSMDGDETKDPVMGSEDGGRGLETVVEEVLTPVADGGGDAEVAGGGGVGRLGMLKTKLLASKNFEVFSCVFICLLNKLLQIFWIIIQETKSNTKSV